MRLTLLMAILFVGAPVWSQATSTKASPAKAAAPKKDGAVPSQPPAGAEKTADGFYRWKDAAGDWWLYKQTPFGWSKAKEKDIEAAKRVEEKSPPIHVIRVSESSDEITFEKPSPFSKSLWTKKKSELTAEETEALERWNAAKVAASKPAAEKE